MTREENGMGRIRNLRLQTGLTQQGFADLIGCPKRTVERWEYRKDPPEYVVKLIEFYINHKIEK